MLLDARNGDINVERDAHQVAAHIRDDIANGEGNWTPAHSDRPLAESNSSPPPAFVLSLDVLMDFSVDADALESWLRPIHSEDLELSLPSRASESPSGDLSTLVCHAIDNGALIGDPRLRLTVYEGDDDESTGYYAVLHNVTGDQRFVGITSGWIELDFADPTATPLEQAREYLTVVCGVANTVIALASRVGDHAPATVHTTQATTR